MARRHGLLCCLFQMCLSFRMEVTDMSTERDEANVFLVQPGTYKESQTPPSSAPPPLHGWRVCGCAIVFLQLQATLCGVQFGLLTQLGVQSFLVPLWPVGSGRSVPH